MLVIFAGNVSRVSSLKLSNDVARDRLGSSLELVSYWMSDHLEHHRMWSVLIIRDRLSMTPLQQQLQEQEHDQY